MARLCTGITAGRSNSRTSGSILRTGKKHSSLCLCLWLNYDDINLSQHVLASSTVTYRTIQYCGGGLHTVIYGPWRPRSSGVHPSSTIGWVGRDYAFFSMRARLPVVWYGLVNDRTIPADTGQYVLGRHGMTLPDSNHSIILISISAQGPHVVTGKGMRGQMIAQLTRPATGIFLHIHGIHFTAKL